MVNKILNFLGSRLFLWLTILFFVLVSLWSAVSIRYGTPPDEVYHVKFIDFYASRSILAGPLVSQQDKATLSLGELERNPNYLYHYTLSFPFKLIKKVTGNVNLQVLGLRLINIVMVCAGLYVLYRILALARLKQLQINLVFLMTVFTGMFTWMSGAVNYDNLAMPLFWATLYVLLLLLKKISITNLIAFAMLAMLTVLIKTSFAPIILLALAVAIIISRDKIRNIKPALLKNQFAKDWQGRKLVAYALLTLFILTSAVFLERIGGNIVRYQAISPSCPSIHSHEECLNNGLYVRSYDQKKVVEQLKAQDMMPEADPIDFTGNWIDLMVMRVYFYFGKLQIQPNDIALTVISMNLLFTLVLVGIKRTKVFQNSSQFFLFITGLIYVVVLFIFNLNSYLSTAAKFGYQGRYLVPVLPFLYMAAVLLFFAVHKQVSNQSKKILTVGVIVLSALNIYFLAPPLVLLRGATPDWFNHQTQGINDDISDVLEAIQLVDPESLKVTQ